MFFPDSGSNSVGGVFSGLTMLRPGVPPHMVQSAARVVGEKRAKPQAARWREAFTVFLVRMVVETLWGLNPKSEARNPKQIHRTEIQNSKRDSVASCFVLTSLDFGLSCFAGPKEVSDFGF